ncbi:MAG: flagellar basal body P-ring formation chaperone FlgA [Bryobacterales bacterium]|nr:flagellar basal body P-ring formation chaperone FlgA [Bryobacterales bacterium]
MMVLYLVFLVAVAEGSCVLVQGDSILDSDLESVLGGASTQAAGRPLMRAPVAGARRWIGAEELTRLSGVRPAEMRIPPQGICVERAARHLDESLLRECLRKAIQDDTVSVEILDFSRYPLPEGQLQFLRSGLMAPPSARPDRAVLWRGRVLSDDRRTTPVWVRLRIHAERDLPVAARDLIPGKPLAREDIMVSRQRIFPLQITFADAGQALGQTVRRRVAAGEPLLASVLKKRRTVEGGDAVTAEVDHAGIRLRLPAIAETGGRDGEFIWLKPAKGGRRFRGRIQEHGLVIVEAESDKQTSDNASDDGAPLRSGRMAKTGSGTTLRD